MAASSDHSARARIWVAFLLLFVVLAAVSVGVYYLGKLQETMAALEGRIALDAINAGQIDAALAGHPSNRFLKLIATATKAGIEIRAAAEKLSQDRRRLQRTSIRLPRAAMTSRRCDAN